MVSGGQAGHLYLSVGDGTAQGDVIALYSGDNPYCYMTKGGFHAPPPNAGDPTRTVTLTLNITGRDANDMWDNYRKLETKLSQARSAQGPYGTGAGVTLGVRFDAQNTMVYFDVLDGLLTAPDTLTDLFPVPFMENVSLQLICLPYARGMSITDAVSGTLTNGTAATLYRAQVPGDVPALLKATLVDVSTNSKVINGWKIGQFARRHMASTDFSPILDATAVAPGTATTDSSSYLGASFARITTTTSWQTIAKVSKPSAQYTTGLFDVWVRARDATVPMAAPTDLVASQGSVSVTLRGRNSTAVGTALTVNWKQTTTAGNLLLLNLFYSGSTPTVPAAWTLAKSVAGTSLNIALYYIANAAARNGSETITVLASASLAASLYEVGGIATSSPLDTTSSGTGSSTTWSTGSTSTLAQAYEFVFASDAIQTGHGSGGPSGYTSLGGIGSSDWWTTTSATTAVSASAALVGSANWAALIVAFKAANTTTPALPAATYTLQVTAVDANGNESGASGATAFTLTATGAVLVNWTAPAIGTPVSYNVYFDDGGSLGFQSFNTGSTATSYTLTTTSAASPGAPGGGNLTLSELRAQIGLSSGTILFNQPGFLCQIGNATWEMVYVGTLDLPPQVARDGGTPPDWLLQIQGQRQGAPVTLDVDGVWLIPHFWSQLQTTYNDGAGTAMNLATKRIWVIDTRRDGRTSVQLQSTADSSETGQAVTIGHLYLGPGDTTLIFMPAITSGASDVMDCKFTVQLTITPRYALVSGLLL